MVVSDAMENGRRNEELAIDEQVEEHTAEHGAELPVSHFDKFADLLLALAGHFVLHLFFGFIVEALGLISLTINTRELPMNACDCGEQITIGLRLVTRLSHLDYTLALRDGHDENFRFVINAGRQRADTPQFLVRVDYLRELLLGWLLSVLVGYRAVF